MLSKLPTLPDLPPPQIKPSSHEPIAIVGAACRLPRAHDVNAFWSLLAGEVDAISDTAPARLNLAALYDTRPPTPGRIPSQSGGFLDDIEHFDADFFGITPAVAIRMDPQHRVLLETTGDALTNAGLTATELAGSRTGVYTACFVSEYWDLLRRAGISDLYAAVGTGPWEVPAGQISYQWDLRGPSMGLAANCATSLLGVHLACQSLWTGETDAAIIGGVNLLVAPDMHVALADASLLSPDGRCKFGDPSANGYVRSEGAVVVVLKPLSTAVANGDRIYATVIGSAAVNDGRCADSPVAPGERGQEEMLRTAYHDAGVLPGQIDYVEAHGTGTAVGDPRELRALSRVLGDGRPADSPCLVGSVKSNIGHTEVTAGLAGLLKVSLALQHRTVPATLHTHTDSTALPGADLPIELVTKTRPWPSTGRPATAGVSSFGLAGTNVHVVLAEAPRVRWSSRPDTERPRALPISARSPRALRVLAGRYADLLDSGERHASLHDVCFSSGVRRTQYEHRIAVVANGRRAMSAALRGYAAGKLPKAVTRQPQPPATAPRVAFVFTGQGGQWAGMARGLLRTCPAFRHRLRECGNAIAAELGWSPEPAVRDGARLSAMHHMQPTTWAIQTALADVWQEWGVRPDLVIGHSMGEIAAAVVAGAMTVAEGAAVVCRRARLLMERPNHGAMWAVQLGPDEAQAAVAEFGGPVYVAVINSEFSTVLAGEETALAALVDRLRADGVFCRRVPVEFASHSPLVEGLRGDLEAALAELSPRPGSVPMYSTVLGARTDGADCDGRYWMENLRRPVQFLPVVRQVVAESPDTFFLEIGPHPGLRSAIEDTVGRTGHRVRVAHSLRRDRPDLEELMINLGVAYTHGCEPDWAAVYQHARFVPTPSYPWQGKRFWIDVSEISPDVPAPAAPVAQTNPTASTARPAPPDTEHWTLERLTEQLTARTAEVLAVRPDDVDVNIPLTRTGLDSVLATKLRARMRQDFELEIPLRTLLGAGSLMQIASEVHATIVGQES